MRNWIKPIEVDALEDGKQYFIARRPLSIHELYLFWSEDGHGKRYWMGKPGLAIRYAATDNFRAYLRTRNDIVAVEVPKDADVRWKKRVIVYRNRKK